MSSTQFRKQLTLIRNMRLNKHVTLPKLLEPEKEFECEQRRRAFMEVYDEFQKAFGEGSHIGTKDDGQDKKRKKVKTTKEHNLKNKTKPTPTKNKKSNKHPMHID